MMEQKGETIFRLPASSLPVLPFTKAGPTHGYGYYSHFSNSFSVMEQKKTYVIQTSKRRFSFTGEKVKKSKSLKGFRVNSEKVQN